MLDPQIYPSGVPQAFLDSQLLSLDPHLLHCSTLGKKHSPSRVSWLCVTITIPLSYNARESEKKAASRDTLKATNMPLFYEQPLEIWSGTQPSGTHTLVGWPLQMLFLCSVLKREPVQPS